MKIYLLGNMYNAPYAQNWYKHKPQRVVETEGGTILWNFSIQTDRIIQANSPDLNNEITKMQTN